MVRALVSWSSLTFRAYSLNAKGNIKSSKITDSLDSTLTLLRMKMRTSYLLSSTASLGYIHLHVENWMHVLMSLISGIAYFKSGDIKKKLTLKQRYISLSCSSCFFLLSMALSCNLEALEAIQPLV